MYPQKFCLMSLTNVFDAVFESAVDECFCGGEPGRYTGQVNEAGDRHGRGMMHYSKSGDTYEGEWRHDRREGHGIETCDNGDKYVGKWLANKKHGRGMLDYISEGYRYEGGFEEGSFAGHGTMTRLVDGKVLAKGNWTTRKWTESCWEGPYPREGDRGAKVTARVSTGSPAPRKPQGYLF